MTQVPVPGGHGDGAGQGEQLGPNRTDSSASGRLEEADSMQDGPESPSDAAVLHLVLLPTDKITLDWPAMIDAARPMAALSLMGALASAVAIYAARAAKPSRALTVTAVGLELALAYIVCRPAKGAPRKTASSGSGRSSRGRA